MIYIYIYIHIYICICTPYLYAKIPSFHEKTVLDPEWSHWGSLWIDYMLNWRILMQKIGGIPMFQTSRLEVYASLIFLNLRSSTMDPSKTRSLQCFWLQVVCLRKRLDGWFPSPSITSFVSPLQGGVWPFTLILSLSGMDLHIVFLSKGDLRQSNDWNRLIKKHLPQNRLLHQLRYFNSIMYLYIYIYHQHWDYH